MKRDSLLIEHLDIRLYEAFLESGPQAALQIMIAMARGFSGYNHVATIVTSLLSLTLSAKDFFWQYPTKVINDTILLLILKYICTFQNWRKA